MGGGHWLHSDRGPVVCPCHWSPAKVALVARRLQDSSHVSAVATASLSESLDVQFRT